MSETWVLNKYLLRRKEWEVGRVLLKVEAHGFLGGNLEQRSVGMFQGNACLLQSTGGSLLPHCGVSYVTGW